MQEEAEDEFSIAEEYENETKSEADIEREDKNKLAAVSIAVVHYGVLFLKSAIFTYNFNNFKVTIPIYMLFN